MRIGELADEVGVDPKTIRYYESIALLPEPPRTAAGYRHYGPEDVERLAFVRRATELDLRLDEIREILALRDRGVRPCDYVLEVARQRITELDQRIVQMRQARNELERLLARTPSAEQAGRYCELIEHRTSNGA
ncbi:MAG: heavy metal-responsive transcriptional regulator [Actinobacteria bacterium]|nr:heavy metal-responsive transcriptional regulator [Actinomycetota bacterium]